MPTPGTSEAPLRVAIIGAGPAAFYAAGHLLKNKANPDLVATVDMFDRLPTPWGLVRAGVAPDHPNIKAVSRVYEKTAADPRFRFFGNVEFGVDVTREDLVERYHAVIYAVGAQTDKHMGIPGEGLPGSWAATEFVAGWIKRGPTGVIGTNKRDAQETVDLLIEDLHEGRLLEPADPSLEGIETLLRERKPTYITYDGWESIDAVEKAAGEPQGRPRVKLCTFEELLEAADSTPSVAG